MAQISAIIPFSGFYESWHDTNLDDALQCVCQNSGGDTNEALQARAWDGVNWRAAHVAYAKAYAENFAREFKIGGLTFESLQSPREYNFTTDRIFVHIPGAELARIYAATPRDILESVAEQEFTSRDGFISFYSNDPANWGDIKGWDHNHFFALISAYVLHMRDGEEFDHEAEHNLMENDICNGGLDNILFTDCAPILQRCAGIASYLRAREDRTYRKTGV